jgi:hypothetical protein
VGPAGSLRCSVTALRWFPTSWLRNDRNFSSDAPAAGNSPPGGKPAAADGPAAFDCASFASTNGAGIAIRGENASGNVSPLTSRIPNDDLGFHFCLRARPARTVPFA